MGPHLFTRTAGGRYTVILGHIDIPEPGTMPRGKRGRNKNGAATPGEHGTPK